jgi:hypothetical protein
VSATFDRFMVSNSIGTNRKLRRLPVAQRWIYVAGVLALASQSPIRWALLITDGEPVTAEDLAQEATVKLSDAKAALASFRRFGMLERDADGVDWVHDWDSMNKDPKPSDSPDATRARKRAQRDREREGRHANVTRDNPGCHAPEVEERKKEKPPVGPQGGNNNIDEVSMGDAAPSRPASSRKRDLEEFAAEMGRWSSTHFPAAEVGAVGAAVSWLQPRTTGAVTAAALHDLAMSSDVWAAQLLGGQKNQAHAA